MRNRISGMAFDALASRILWLYDNKNKHKVKPKTLKQSIRNVQIDLTSIQISQFSKLDNKRFYFADRFILRPVSHFYLQELRKYKKDSQNLIEKLCEGNKFHMLKVVNKAILLNKSCRFCKKYYFSLSAKDYN